MKKLKQIAALPLHPRLFPFLLITVFALLLVTLWGSEGDSLDRLSVLVAAIVAFSAVVSMIKSQESIDVSKGLLDEAIRQREANSSPHVVVWFESSESWAGSSDLVVKNVGRGVAYDVKLSFVSGGEDYADEYKFPLRIIKTGIGVLAPDREVREIFGGVQFMKDYPFVLAVSYYPNRAGTDEEQIVEEFVMNTFENFGSIFESDDVKHLGAIVAELKRMNKRHRGTIRYVGEPTDFPYRVKRAFRERIDGLFR